VPSTPIPSDLDAFLARPNPAIVATLRADGSPHSVATWYDWERGHVLLNMDESRVRLAHMRRDRRIALTVLDADDWYVHVSLLGSVVEIAVDHDLADIDRLSRRYTGQAFGTRDRRRVSAWMLPERWHGWGASGNLVPRG